MKHLLAILILPFCVTSYGQRNNGIKRIIELNKVFDTIRIQEFDIKGNLIFWKYFPDDYGIAQILTYSYNRNKKTNYIWLHSNAGFIINEYVYDTITNKVITYGYVPKNSLKNGLAFINSVYSFNDLKNSKLYNKSIKNRNKHLKELSLYQDTTIMKTIEFNENGDTTSITNFDYCNGLLKSKIEISKPENSIRGSMYEYDSLRNEIGWLRIDDKDTSVVFKYKYSNKLLIESLEYLSGELSTRIKYDYLDSLLIKETMFDSEGSLMRTIDYIYNNDNVLVKKVDNYTYMNELEEINYKYETY